MARKTELEKLRELQGQHAARKREDAERRAEDKRLREAMAEARQVLLLQAQQEVGALAYEFGLIPLDKDGVPQVDAAQVRKGFTLLARLIQRGHLEWHLHQTEPDPDVEREVQALIDHNGTLVVVGEDDEPLTRRHNV